MFFSKTPFFLEFPHPAPPNKRQKKIFPLFIPFAGCKNRCVFCAQEAQTGTTALSIKNALDHAALALEQRIAKKSSPLELAFFGGTFTSLTKSDFTACIEFAAFWRKRGAINAVRCSTRPDALSAATLLRMKHAGFTTIELGIQSFSTSALACAERGYTQETACQACAMVKDAGFDLGIQLLPGMPGVSLDVARKDIHIATSLGPDIVRLYPCLVFQNTPLAHLWKNNKFSPWDMKTTLSFLAESCLLLWRAGIRIARIGVAPEDGLEKKVLAGPAHPSLGNRVRGLALGLFLKERLQEAKCHFPLGAEFFLGIPKDFQGDFWGHQKELEPFYQSIGITRRHIYWHQGPAFILSSKTP